MLQVINILCIKNSQVKGINNLKNTHKPPPHHSIRKNDFLTRIQLCSLHQASISQVNKHTLILLRIGVIQNRDTESCKFLALLKRDVARHGREVLVVGTIQRTRQVVVGFVWS